jgi:hypothetical protein
LVLTYTFQAYIWRVFTFIELETFVRVIYFLRPAAAHRAGRRRGGKGRNHSRRRLGAGRVRDAKQLEMAP